MTSRPNVRGPAILFCPADRPDRYGKALNAADSVIFDLEDAVHPEGRPSARTSLQTAGLDPERSVIRINPAPTGDHLLDLAALEPTPHRTVMLAKSETSASLDRLADRGFRVIALCETALGVENAREIAEHPAVRALMWGAEDLAASLGGRSSRLPSGGYRDFAVYARARVLIAAGAAGKPAIDAVHLDIADVNGLRREAEDAAASGFAATACIHPSQVEVVRLAYRPDEQERAWAERVLAEAATRPGVFRFEGRMIDEPVLRQARSILGR